MRRFRRRRKPAVVWLPTPGTTTFSAGVANQAKDCWEGTGFTGPVQLNGANAVTIEFPLVQDVPDLSEGVVAGLAVHQVQSLSQVASLGFRLRRIVGQLYIGAWRNVDQLPTITDTLLASVGIIVRRTDATGLAALPADEVAVGALQSETDPWLWRRNYLLNTGIAWGGANHFWAKETNTTGPTHTHKVNNRDMGCLAESSVIDTKVARRIGPEERLFMDITFWDWRTLTGGYAFEQLEVGPLQNVNVSLGFDYRVLATLGWNKGNRRNASR